MFSTPLTKQTRVPKYLNALTFPNKEIKIALDIADEKPEDTIYIIRARLNDCPMPTPKMAVGEPF